MSLSGQEMRCPWCLKHKEIAEVIFQEALERGGNWGSS